MNNKTPASLQATAPQVCMFTTQQRAAQSFMSTGFLCPPTYNDTADITFTTEKYAGHVFLVSSQFISLMVKM